MTFRRRFALQSALLTLTIWLVHALPAGANVVSESRIDAALASSDKIHSCHDDPSFGKARCVSVDTTGYQGFLVEKSLDYGFLASGDDLLVVPLQSGGSGAVFVTVLFTLVMTKPYFIGVVPSDSGHLDVYISGSRIVVETPVYKRGDANCCPSAHHFVTYGLRRRALVKINEFEERLGSP